MSWSKSRVFDCKVVHCRALTFIIRGHLYKSRCVALGSWMCSGEDSSLKVSDHWPEVRTLTESWWQRGFFLFFGAFSHIELCSQPRFIVPSLKKTMKICMKIQFDTFCYRNCELRCWKRCQSTLEEMWLHPGIDANCQPNKRGRRWDKRIHARHRGLGGMTASLKQQNKTHREMLMSETK